MYIISSAEIRVCIRLGCTLTRDLGYLTWTNSFPGDRIFNLLIFTIIPYSFNEQRTSVQSPLHYSLRNIREMNQCSTCISICGIRCPKLQIPRFKDSAFLPGLPHLLSKSNQTIEELFSESNGSELLLISVFVNNQKAISDLSIRRPSNNQLRLPPKPADFLDFLHIESDISSRV